MSQDPALPKFEVPIADKSGVTTKNWYFFFSQLLASVTGGVTQIIAGTNVTISPTSGVGNVTVNATGGSGSGTVSDITSTGGTITVTNPTGPTVNLEVTTPGGSGTVTSVGLSAGSANIVLTGTNPVTTSGTIGVDLSTTAKSDLALAATALQSTSLTDGSTTPIYNTSTTAGASTFTLKTESANTVFAGPTTGAAAQPGFRGPVFADISSAIPNFNITPDTHPAFPTGVGVGPNDEFETGTSIDTAGTRYSGATAWSWVNQGSFTAPVSAGSVVMSSPATASVYAYILQAPPAGAWTYVAKMRAAPGSAGGAIGLFQFCVYNSATSKSISIGFATQTTYTGDILASGVFSSSFIASAPLPGAGADRDWYWRISFDGSATFTFGISANGINFTPIGGSTNWSTIGSAMTGIGLVLLNTATAITQWGFCDWFRRTA